jgi:hypothetical protein
MVDYLKIYLPQNSRSQLAIQTSIGKDWTGYLSEDGVLHYQRAAVNFPLSSFMEPITISLSLNGKIVDSKILQPASMYLFSCRTGEPIPIGTKRDWGDRQYYLFTTRNVESDHSSLEAERFNAKFEPYSVYQITWEDTSQPFRLQVGNAQWSFQKQRFLFFQLKGRTKEGYIQLASHQVHEFTQDSLSVVSNIDLIQTPLICQVYFAGELIEEQKTSECLSRMGELIYCFTQPFLDRLNQVTVRRNKYGRCNILLNMDGKLLEQTTITLIPEVKIGSLQLKRPLLESESLRLTVISPHVKIWDAAQSRESSTATIEVRPKLLASSKGKQLGNGITAITSHPLTAPLLFPSLGETIEIVVQPTIFGFRLYERMHNTQPYKRIDSFNYSSLDASALYVFAEPGCQIELCTDTQTIRSYTTDADGDLLIKPLGLLQKYCQTEQTPIHIRSKGQKSTFFIRWTPFLQEMFVEKNRVHLQLNGPQHTGIILRLLDINNQIHYAQSIPCRGEPFEMTLGLPLEELGEQQYYLVPVYYLTDKTELPCRWQCRIENHNRIKVISEWLQAGTGFSDEALLQLFHVGGT